MLLAYIKARWAEASTKRGVLFFLVATIAFLHFHLPWYAAGVAGAVAAYGLAILLPDKQG